MPADFAEKDASRLLFDDEHSNPYGTFNDQSPGVNHADPQEVQRETEALQKVVAQTSKWVAYLFPVRPLHQQDSVPARFTC